MATPISSLLSVFLGNLIFHTLKEVGEVQVPYLPDRGVEGEGWVHCLPDQGRDRARGRGQYKVRYPTVPTPRRTSLEEGPVPSKGWARMIKKSGMISKGTGEIWIGMRHGQ